MSLPRISLVTPSFNQGAFLDQAIRSVLGQRYPDLQYGIVDGGSGDHSLDVIYRHRAYLSYVICEPDRGQSDAINKGLRLADGEVVGWLCSDDLLEPGALQYVGEYFRAHPECAWLIGHVRRIDAQGADLGRMGPAGDFTPAGVLLRDQPFNVPQPATFWRRELLDRAGLLDPRLHHCMDFDLWVRFLLAGARPRVTQQVLASYREHPASKTCSQPDRFIAALIEIEKRYAQGLPWRERRRLQRKVGYQRRALAVRTEGRRLWRHVVSRPWWLLSEQVRAALAA